jgi:hypothetical protein
MMITSETGKNKNRGLWIGLGAAALFCLCAVVVAGFILMQVGRQVQEGFETDPEAASEAAHAIVDYELPPGYQERISMNFLVYTFVMIGPENTETTNQPLIMLAQFDPVGTSQEQMEQQIRQSFEQQAGQRGLDMQLVEVENRIIRGEEVEVTTYEGSDRSGDVVRQLITSFPGKDGIAMLMIMGPAQGWDEQVIDDFIASIH